MGQGDALATARWRLGGIPGSTDHAAAGDDVVALRQDIKRNNNNNIYIIQLSTQMPDISRPRYYTINDVASHNTQYDCWVSLFGKVLDITSLLKENEGILANYIHIEIDERINLMIACQIIRESFM